MAVRGSATNLQKRSSTRIPQLSTEITINQRYDFWMDNAIENLYSLTKQVAQSNPDCVACSVSTNQVQISIFNKERFLRSLSDLVKAKRDSVIFSEIKEQKTGRKRNIKLGYVLLQYGKSRKGKNRVKEKMFDDRVMLSRLSLAFSPEAGQKTCILCGSAYQNSVDNLKQSVFPLATRNAALSGTLRKDDYFRSLCPTCYALGVLEWIDDRVLYRSQQKGESIVLYPSETDLKSLNRIKSLSKNLSQRYINSNVHAVTRDRKNVIVSGPYSALLLFLEQTIESLSTSGKEPMEDYVQTNILCENWTCVRVPSGIIKNILVEEIGLPAKISALLSNLDTFSAGHTEALRLYAEVLNYVDLLGSKKGPKHHNFEETLDLRERLAESLIKDDFHRFATLFIPRSQVHAYIIHERWQKLDRFLCAWQLNDLALPEETLAKIKQASNLIAELNLSNISIVYKIERARNLSEFIEALWVASRRLVVRGEDFAGGDLHVQPTSLDSLIQLISNNSNRWGTFRDLLLIYTAMYYAIKRRSE